MLSGEKEMKKEWRRKIKTMRVGTRTRGKDEEEERRRRWKWKRKKDTNGEDEQLLQISK